MFVCGVNLPVFNVIFFSDCLHCIFMLCQLVIPCRCSLRFFRSFFFKCTDFTVKYLPSFIWTWKKQKTHGNLIKLHIHMHVAILLTLETELKLLCSNLISVPYSRELLTGYLSKTNVKLLYNIQYIIVFQFFNNILNTNNSSVLLVLVVNLL